jgi:hypothetical protein
MLEYQTTLSFQQPIETVFTFLTTAANYPRWDVLSVEMVSLDGEPWRLGTRIRERRRLGPQIQTLEARVAAYQAPRQLIIESLGTPQFRGGWELRAGAGVTQATYLVELTFTGFLRALEPLIAPSFAMQLDTSMARLQALLNPLQ